MTYVYKVVLSVGALLLAIFAMAVLIQLMGAGSTVPLGFSIFSILIPALFVIWYPSAVIQKRIVGFAFAVFVGIAATILEIFTANLFFSVTGSLVTAYSIRLVVGTIAWIAPLIVAWRWLRRRSVTQSA